MDNPNKPPTSEEPEAFPFPAPARSVRSPFRPKSLRRRQDQVPDPPPAVERPQTTVKFDASPATVNAALAKAGASPEDSVLVWKADADVEVVEEPDSDA